MEIRKSSWHYRWMDFVYRSSVFSPAGVPRNICSYFWGLVFSIPHLLITGIVALFCVIITIGFIVTTYFIKIICWFFGFASNFQDLDSDCYAYKYGLYGRPRREVFAPWEGCTLGTLLWTCHTHQTSVVSVFTHPLAWIELWWIVPACSVLILCGICLTKSAGLILPFLTSIKEKYCTRIKFID